MFNGLVVLFLNQDEYDLFVDVCNKINNPYLKAIREELEPSPDIENMHIADLSKSMFCYATIYLLKHNRVLHQRFVEIGRLQDVDFDECLQQYKREKELFNRYLT